MVCTFAGPFTDDLVGTGAAPKDGVPRDGAPNDEAPNCTSLTGAAIGVAPPEKGPDKFVLLLVALNEPY